MSTIVITYDGTDITTSVLFDSATFESQLGAYPGAFEFTVRDEDQSLSFTTGKEVTLSIDGVRRYGGYVMQVSRTFAFPVVDTVNLGPSGVTAREWQLRGLDYNILFDKRVVFNKANPDQLIPNYSGTTTDAAVLAALFEDYLDLEDDGLDVSTFIDEVGDPTPDGDDGAYVNPGEPWRKQMEDLSQFTGAIWYIDADKKVHYQALEDVSASWGFSDTPNRTTTFGFREFEYIDDATNVVNDALVWGGSPYGSTGVTAKTVFAETENDVSEAAVGRWQYAEKHFNEVGFFKASGCAVRGKVIVYGDPGAAGPGLGDQSRGLQNPQKNIRLTWFDSTVPSPLVAGSVVNVHLSVWGDIDVSLPVRSVTITFPVNYEAKYEGFLGIQTSDPWSLWKYLRLVHTNPPPPAPIPTSSDGSDDSVPPGTQVGVAASPVPDGSNVVFTIPYGYMENSTRVFVNGLLQTLNSDYTESDPAQGAITFTTPPASGATIYVTYTAIPTQGTVEPDSLYGPAIAGDTLANTTTDQGDIFYEFYPRHSGELVAVHVYFEGGHPGYSVGRGGELAVTLLDPSGSVIDSTTIPRWASSTPTDDERFPILNLSGALTAGHRYRIRMVNLTSDEFRSPNSIFSWQSGLQPRYPDVRIYRENELRENYIPAFQWDFDDSVVEGNGYMGAFQLYQTDVGGSGRARTVFTPDHDVTFRTIGVRAKRQSSHSRPLTVTVGGVSATLPGSSFPVGVEVDGPGNVAQYATVSVPQTTLSEGVSYTIEFSGQNDGDFLMQALQKGSAYGFSSYFQDGHAEKSTNGGSSWSGVNGFGTSDPRTDGDLQWFLAE